MSLKDCCQDCSVCPNDVKFDCEFMPEEYKEIYEDCLGECRICLLEGGCELELFLKRRKEHGRVC